ncbi:MAG: ph-response sensor protein [Thelocarpon superellum]|nr:MAG: ph-response sensor protein [Thelocarpon superellum]
MAADARANVASDATSQPTSQAAAKGRRLLSRFTAPFVPKARTVSEYFIRPEEPHRLYAPGELVRGAVVLTVAKPLRISHLVVGLCGYVRVLRPGISDNALAGDGPYGANRTKRATESFGNGFASLFHDEVVLCGEGRLEAGVYEFHFELDFPSKKLPSSIDFERGTVSYALSSTLTRPTTIAPTSTCHRKVRLVETIDVAFLQQSRSRRIVLEPIRRRSKVKSADARAAVEAVRNGSASGPASASGTSPAPATTSHAADGRHSRLSDERSESPQSPAPSEISGTSVASGSTGSARVGSRLANARPSGRTNPPSAAASLADRTITATVEVMRGGCLRGDTLPLKIRVQHTKPVKSLHGIIVTLYRQGRVDSHPASLAKVTGDQASTGKAPVEEYYPRSRTGLGGLSLSSAGSSSLFRKDLSQAFAPLIIDPHSLTAEIKASVRVPDDAFPTISCVPGAIISFKYFIEIIIDLNGKLAGSQSAFVDLGVINMATPPQAHGRSLGNGDLGAEKIFAELGGGIVDTDRIRRENSVVSCLFEVVVGTMDSSRGRRHEARGVAPPAASLGVPSHQAEGESCEAREYCPAHDRGKHMSEGDHVDPRILDQVGHARVGPGTADAPPPDVVVSESVDEKTILRQAEERLLPSAPPGLLNATGLSPATHGPSAPPLSEINEEPGDVGAWTILGDPEPTAPTDDSGATHTHASHASEVTEAQGAASEDKQELERRRLQTEASTPHDGPAPEEDGREAVQVTAPTASAPPAPLLMQDAERDLFHSYVTGEPFAPRENLPRYER